MATPQQVLKVYAEQAKWAQNPAFQELGRSIELELAQQMRSSGALAELTEMTSNKQFRKQLVELGRQMETKWPVSPELDASVRKVAEQLAEIAPQAARTRRLSEQLASRIDMTALQATLSAAAVRIDPETVERLESLGDELETAADELQDEDWPEPQEPTEEERREIADWFETVNSARRQLLYSPNPWLIFVFDLLINLALQILFASFSPDTVVEIHKTVVERPVVDIDFNFEAGSGPPGH